MALQETQTLTLTGEDARKRNLNNRLDDIGWGLLLIVTGGIWLVPDGRIPEGSWLIGVGLIMLGLNAIRYFNGLKIRGFTTVLGILALCAGLWSVFSVRLPLFPLFFILMGGGIIVKSLVQQKHRPA
jgi:hypothetical protein